jgi:hypothetical protein
MEGTMKAAMQSIFLSLFFGVAAADEGRAVKILARGPWPHLPTHSSAGIGTDRGHHLWLLRSEQELAKTAGNSALITVPKALKVNAIDFKKQMLIVIEDGTQPLVGVSGGGAPSALYAVAVYRIDRDDDNKTMTVHWRLVPRGKDQGILTRPLEAVLVEGFDGEVKFNKLPPADKPGKEPPPSGKEAKPIARAFWADGWKPEAPPQQWFVREYTSLIDPRLRAPEHILERMREEAAVRYAKALKVDNIDFTKQMVIGVSGGVQPAGARVEITKVEVDAQGKTMTVSWRLHGPKPETAGEGVTHAAEVILAERFLGNIRFRDQNAKKD